jgi:thiamine biosynthesis lipoprotein
VSTAQPAAAPRRAWVEQLMGMPVSIHLRGEGSRGTEADARVQAAYDELRAVDVLFSTYREDSEVSRIERGELEVADAHPLVREVVDLCATARTLTGGAFDAWRPDAGDPAGRRRFDPTGLVKGWAVQRAADHLVAGLGCDVVVNAGGDVAARTGGAAPQPWRVGIEDPTDPARVVTVLPLVTGGVATSGTAHRGAHLVDPVDGRPVTGLLSVTVTGPSLLWADVLATAAFVRGADALAVVEAVPGYEGLVIAADGTRSATAGLVQLPLTSSGTSPKG